MSETEPAPTTGCSYPDTFAGRLRAYSDVWRNHAPDDDIIGEGPDFGDPRLLRSDLDAALTEIVQLDRKLDNLRFELNARIAAETGDAAAGSYAGRAKEAETALAELRKRLGNLKPAGMQYRANGPHVHGVTEGNVRDYFLDQWVEGYWPESRQLYAGPWQRIEGLRDADAVPRTALERAAGEQGDGEGGGA